MNDKTQILAEINTALENGTITEGDIRGMLNPNLNDPTQQSNTKKLSAVDVMFYAAGLVLFISIMSFIGQTWDSGGAFTHIVLSAGIGSLLWTGAYKILSDPVKSDVRKGLANAMMLTGSLSVIAGGFITTNYIVDGFDDINFIPAAFTFLVLGLVHFLYDRLVRDSLIVLIGAFLTVATLPALLFGLLENSDLPMDFWSFVFVLSTILLAYSSRLIARSDPSRSNLIMSFDSLSAFLGLGTIFLSSFGDYGIFWLLMLFIAVTVLFYFSIISQNKHLLGNASFFLVVGVITVSFKYFSGAGASFSLITAAVGILGSAAVATNINKKYFKPIE